MTDVDSDPRYPDIHARTYNRQYVFIWNDRQPDLMWYITLSGLDRSSAYPLQSWMVLTRATASYYTRDRVMSYPMTARPVGAYIDALPPRDRDKLGAVDVRLAVSEGL